VNEELIAERYDSLLIAAGFRYEDDYSDFQWKGGERSIYKIEELFPSLIPNTIPKEIRGVKYMLSLADCSQFLVTPTDLILALQKGKV
jgi:hypothetical protein